MSQLRLIDSLDPILGSIQPRLRTMQPHEPFSGYRVHISHIILLPRGSGKPPVSCADDAESAVATSSDSRASSSRVNPVVSWKPVVALAKALCTLPQPDRPGPPDSALTQPLTTTSTVDQFSVGRTPPYPDIGGAEWSTCPVAPRELRRLASERCEVGAEHGVQQIQPLDPRCANDLAPLQSAQASGHHIIR